MHERDGLGMGRGREHGRGQAAGSVPQRDTDMVLDLERVSHLALSREGNPVGESMSVADITAIPARHARLLTLDH
jgi:hypothetical protein